MIKSIFLKKVVFFITAFTILLQIVFLLAAKNNLLAQVDETTTISPPELKLDGTPTSSSISLKWTDNSTIEDKVNIERKLTTANDYLFLIQLTGSDIISYTDAAVAAGTSYDYRVQACRSGYGCSEYAYLIGVSSASGSDTISPSSPTAATSSAPLPPSSVTASSTVGKIYVSWPISTSAVKYSIYRKVNDGSYQALYTNITNLYYHDLNVVTGNTYQYKVMGCDATICSTTGTESNSVTYSGGEVSCTSLILTLNDRKTAYVVGDTVNYTWTCSPGGSASNVSMRLYKPDSTSVNYNNSLNSSTQTMGFGTSNLMPGTHILKACFDPDCKPETVYASQTFTVISGTTTVPTVPTVPTFTLSPQVLDITGYPSKRLMKVIATSSPTGHTPTSITGEIKDSAGNVIASTFYLTYQTGGYWTYEYDISSLSSGSYYFCASGMYNTISIPWVCSVTAFTILNTNAPTFTVTSEIDGTSAGNTITGIKTASAKATPSISGYSLSDLRFKFKNTAGTYTFYPSTSSVNHWEASIDTSKLVNGNYDFFAEGFYGGAAYGSKALNINVSNISNTAISVSFLSTPAQSFSGNASLYAQTNQTAESVNFKVISTSGNHVSYPGTLTSANQYYFVWPTTNFSNGIYKIEVSAVKTGQAAAYAYLENISIENLASTTSLDVSFINIPPMPLKGDNKIFIKTSSEPELVSFKVQRDLGSSAYLAATKIDATNFYFLWNTGQYYDGNYTVSATAKKASYEKTSSINITVANYSAATAPPAATEPFILTFNEKFQPPLSGDKNITVSSNLKMDSCKFNIEGPRYAEFAGTNNGLQCSFLLRTSNFLDGKYLIRAVAASGANTKEIILDTTFLNQTSTTQPSTLPAQLVSPEYFIPQECKDKGYLTPENCQKYMEIPFECRSKNILDSEACKTYMYQYGMPPECVNQGVQTPEECQKIIFASSMPPECKEAGAATKEECEKIMSVRFMLTPECKSADITNPDACNTYMIEKFSPPECRNAASQDECNYMIRDSYNTFNNLVPVETNAIFNVSKPTSENFPPECKAAQISSPDECKRHMMLLSMPPECREANAATSEECEKIMFKKYGPKECIEAGVFDPIECEKFMFKKYAPEDCKQAGIFNPEACKKYMFEKYNGKDDIPKDKFPIECQKANANTAIECEKVMKTVYMPKECKDKGMTDQKECDAYFEKKYMPNECKEAEASTREECDRVMFKKYAPKECLKAGIEKDDECQKFMFNLYAPKVKCDNMEDWQCKKNLEKSHLGDIIAKQTQFNRIKEKSNEMIGKSMKVETLMESKAFENNGMIPLTKKNTNLKIVSTTENMILNDEDTLVQTGPIAFMIDSDGDGLSDDMESLLGTDPDKTDTDGDGYNDGDEAKTGYDPSGPGLFAKTLSPTEKAMIENKTLEHPKTSGEVSEKLAIEKIENLSDINKREEGGYLLSGKSESGNIVTLYIYSDLPLILIVKADEQGNWEYKLDRSLADGEHEIYVVVNDETGKVVNKSNPASLFVKEAKAVSASEYLKDSVNNLTQETPEDISSNKYNFIVFFSITAALSIFGVMLILRKRKNQSAK